MPRRTGQTPLSRERIVDAALQVIDQAGLDELSMRRLGKELGVDPMAVYHHVESKDALLHAVVRHVFAEMATPSTRGPWQRRVRRWAEAYRAVAEAHPNLVLRIVTDPGAVAVASVLANEVLYAALEASGLPPGEVVRAADLIVDYVNGSVLGHVAGTSEATHAAAVAAFRAELEARPADEVRTQRRLLAEPAAEARPDSFAFGLDIILAGIEARTGN